MSTTWALAAFYEIRVGDTVRSLDHRTGEVIAAGQVDHVIHCKDHDRVVNHTLGLLARSDYPHIERRTSWPPAKIAAPNGS